MAGAVPDAGPPVLVLGGGVTGLGVVRTFGRSGIPVYLHARADDLAARSRWARRVGPEPETSLLTAEGLEALLHQVHLDHAVLMPCSDAAVTAVAALSGELAERYRASVPPLHALERLTDKAGLARLLAEVEVPHPRTYLLEGEADLLALDEGAFRDGFLKPIDSQRFFRHFGKKAFRVAGRAAAVERLRAIHEAGFEVLLQEYVPGPATGHVFLDGFRDRSGQVRSLFARRRLRMYPPDFGNSSLMVSIPAGEVAAAVRNLERLLEAVGYRGIFSAEFKEDARDGTYRLLEVNCRPWWYVEFAERSGAGICLAAYRDALDQKPGPEPSPRLGVRCVYPEYDLAGFRDPATRGGTSAWRWFRPWLGAQSALFVWDDPGPALADAWGRLRRRLGRGRRPSVSAAPRSGEPLRGPARR